MWNISDSNLNIILTFLQALLLTRMSCMCWLFVCVAYPRDPNGAIFNSHLNKESLFKCWEFLFQRPSPNRVCFALLKEGREEMLSVGPRHPSPLCWQYTAPLFYLAWIMLMLLNNTQIKAWKKKHINPRASQKFTTKSKIIRITCDPRTILTDFVRNFQKSFWIINTMLMSE